MMRASEASLVRSWLFCPASRPERFGKAAAAGADAIIVDLEDGVAPGEKDTARRNALAWLDAERTPHLTCCVRANGLRTLAGLRDVVALVESGASPDHLVIPKAE